MEIWEHKFVFFHPKMKGEKDINEMLAEHGEQGWQLVHYATPHAGTAWSFAFKRPKT